MSISTNPTDIDLHQLTGGERLPANVAGETRVMVPLVTLPRACAAAIDEAGGRLATMVGQDERAERGVYSLTYIFALPERRWLTIETVVPGDDPVFPSVTSSVPAAHWYEREVRDMFGLVPDGHPDLRRLVHHDDWPEGVHPLRKDFDPSIPVPRVENEPYRFHNLHGDGIVEIPVGPIHAGVIEPGHFRFAAVGEVVLALEPRLFYTHRGIEKLIEGKSLDHGLQIAERICGACSLSHAISYCQAAETIVETRPSSRAEAIRAIGLELERLYNHVGDTGNLCAGVGFMVGVASGAKLKDDLQRLNERFTGNRFLRGLAAVGGVRRDIDADMAAHLSIELSRIAHAFGDLASMILNSETTMERMRRTGILPLSTAIALGTVGVAARASGVDLDTRRDHPYGAYEALAGALPVPVRQEGDVEARLRIRLEEAAASFAMLQQLLTTLPAGPLRNEWRLPGEDRYAFSATESPRGENLHWLRVDASGAITRYRVRSASFPNWPAVAASVPGNMVPDFPLINKSFELCYACLDR